MDPSQMVGTYSIVALVIYLLIAAAIVVVPFALLSIAKSLKVLANKPEQKETNVAQITDESV